MQRGHWFAIVDEVDSILIDEARTPLIISGEPEQAAETYYSFARAVANLEPGEDYEVDEKFHTASPTESGVDKIEKAIGVDNLYAPENGQLVNHLIQAIKAKELYKRDDEYVVIDGEVKIVDEFTGRIMEGRRWSEGLHQAVEAKEGVRIQEENVTVATITIQNYFRMYEKLAGMTGTAATEAAEFHEIYGLEVVPIPTNVPVAAARRERPHLQDRGGEVRGRRRRHPERNALGQPVLVGTISVEVSEYLSKLLERPRHRARGAERQEPRARGADHRGRRPEGRRHHRHQHGRPRRRHQAGRGRRRPRRPVRAGHRAARVAPHRQPAARPLRPPGRPRRDALLPVRPGRGDPAVRGRPHLRASSTSWARPTARRSSTACSPSASRAPRRRSRSSTSSTARTSSSTTTC